MNRAFKGKSPDGRSWDDLANLAAGKQTSGCIGFSQEYMKSARFLQGDGGWRRVVWMSKTLKERYAPGKAWIATEGDVSTLEELQAFLLSQRWSAKG